MPDQDDIRQIRVVDNADRVLNMGVEIDLTAEEVLARADTGQRRSVYFMPRLAQPWHQLPPNHAAGPAAMHQDERRHNFLLIERHVACWHSRFAETVPLSPLACWSKIRIDRKLEVAAARAAKHHASSVAPAGSLRTLGIRVAIGRPFSGRKGLGRPREWRESAGLARCPASPRASLTEPIAGAQPRPQE